MRRRLLYAVVFAAGCIVSVVLLGQQGLRKVASALRPWPGALAAQASTTDAESARAAQLTLQTELRMTCIAGQSARLLAAMAALRSEIGSPSSIKSRRTSRPCGPV